MGVELTIYNPTAHKLNLFSAIFSHDQKNPSKTGTLMSNVSLELFTALMRQNLKRFNNLSLSQKLKDNKSSKIYSSTITDLNVGSPL